MLVRIPAQAVPPAPGGDPPRLRVPVQFLYARFAYTIINRPREDLHFDAIPEPPMVAVMRGKLRKLQEEEAEAKKARAEGSQASSESDTDGEDGDGDNDEAYANWCVVPRAVLPEYSYLLS